MPWYEMKGFGRDTGRRRKLTVFARNEDIAIDMASEKAIVVEATAEVSPPDIRHFFSKIAGVTHDRGKRQKAISHCQRYEQLMLDSEEDNPKDANAVRVLNSRREHLGYLSSELAAEITPKAKIGYIFGVYIVNLTGGEQDKPTLGVNIVIIEVPPGRTQEEATRYLVALRDSGELEGHPDVYVPGAS
jgi:hypothetical protein